MMLTDRKVSPVFLRNCEAYDNERYNVIANQGSTRSGKTYSITQLLISIIEKEKKKISIVSKTLPHLKRGVLRDFKEIMYDWGLFEEKYFNRSELIYYFDDNSYIEFFSADNAAKLRGPGRDILFVNEVNLLSFEEWQQLIIRTREKSFCDYNPVEEFSWVYDQILTRSDCKFIKSTYLDNFAYLPPRQIEEIERMKDIDYNLWQVFGLGNVAKSTNVVYNNFKVDSNFPADNDSHVVYGIDFGFNHPTALVKINRVGRKLFVQEVLYESGLTTSDLVSKIKELAPDRISWIYGDSASPDRIQEIANAGFNIHPSNKSVLAGIDYLKQFEIIIHPESINLLKEIRFYSWKVDKNGNRLDEPVKYNDDALDALRYAALTHGQSYWTEHSYSFPNSHLDKFSSRSFNKYKGY